MAEEYISLTYQNDEGYAFDLHKTWKYVFNYVEEGEEWYKLTESSYLKTTKDFKISGLPDKDITVTKVVLFWTGSQYNNKSGYITNGTPKVNGISIKSGAQSITLTDSSILENIKNGYVLSILFTYYTPTSTFPSEWPYDSSMVNKSFYSKFEWKDFSIKVYYTLNNATLTTPSVNLSTVTIKSSESTTFTWGASSSTGSNIVSYYQIYKNGKEIEEAKVYPPDVSYSITGSSVGSDSSAVFTVKAISSEPGYDSALSNSYTVQCYKDFVMPPLLLYTNKNSTQAPIITVGTSEPPSITAIWNISDLGGTYDSIKSITFNNTALFTNAESYSIGTISSKTTYTLTITMKSGYSDTSTATANIATVGATSFTSASTGTVGSSTTYSWSEASGATDYYFYLDGDIGDYSGTTTNTSINQNISNYVNNGSSFTFTIYPRANAPYGGYTQGTGIVASQTRAAKPAISGNISITGDTDVPSVYAYNTVNINITNASSYNRVTINANTQTSAIKDFTNNSATTLSTSHNISSISEGTLITYTIKLYNSYGEESEYTYTIVRFQRPTVTITGVSTSSGVTSKTATINFKITPSPHSASGNTYYYPEISYGSQTVKGVTTNIQYNNETSVQVSIDFQSSSTLRTGLSTLYDALRGANDLPIGRPTLSFNIVVYDNAIGLSFYNKASTNYSQVVDYRAYPTNSILTVSSSAEYPSSQDTIKLTSSASITDAVGNTGGLIYNITRTNPYATFTGASVDDVLGTINSDTTYTYTLTVSKQYKDGNASASLVPASINVYRFVPPSFTVSNLRWEQNKLMGTINISDLGGSNNKAPNISNYTYTVKEIEGNNLYTKETPNGDYSNNQVEQDFTYLRTEGSKEIYLQIVVTANSKSGNFQQTILGPFLVKPSGIPFSIRKNGAGVHVEANFNPNTSDAAFKVIGNSDTDAIVEFSNGNNRRNSDILLNSNGTKMYLSLQCPEGKEPYFTIIFE